MNWMAKSLAWAAGCVLLASAVHGVTEDLLTSGERDYRVIIDRNPFNLKPPVVAPPVTNTPPAPKDDILLTGIASIGGLRAYFMTKPPQGKTPEYYSLAPDERRNDLEVLGIDVHNKSVRVRNSGIESVMTFAANGVKPPAGVAPPPGAPGAAVAGGAVITTPGAVPGSTPPPLPGVSTPGAVTPGATTPGTGRIRTIPSRNMRMPGTASVGGAGPGAEYNQPPARPDPDAAVQDALRIELQRRANPNITLPPTPGLPQ